MMHAKLLSILTFLLTSTYKYQLSIFLGKYLPTSGKERMDLSKNAPRLQLPPLKCVLVEPCRLNNSLSKYSFFYEHILYPLEIPLVLYGSFFLPSPTFFRLEFSLNIPLWCIVQAEVCNRKSTSSLNSNLITQHKCKETWKQLHIYTHCVCVCASKKIITCLMLLMITTILCPSAPHHITVKSKRIHT